MDPHDETIRGLREAVDLSPKNIPLRRHLASTLAGLGRFDEAEQAYREALAIAPNDGDIALGLAKVYHQKSKRSQAMVVVEDLIDRDENHAPARVFYARLLLAEGRVSDAVAHYKLGIELDPNVADIDLAGRLGVSTEENEWSSGDVVDGRVREGSYLRDQPDDMDREIEKPTIRFDDVGGMETLKEEIRMKIIYPLTHADVYRAYGKAIGGGIMLFGPPGCGKTYLARATAGELGAGFLSVGINDVLDMWMGNSERNLRQLFDTARRSSPCVLFFDEVDALGVRRSDVSGAGSRQVINQFLAELDGVERSNEGVLILAATNAPWHVDGAFRRPGRFDRVLFVPPPDAVARAEILRLHLRDKPLESIDFDRIANKTTSYSGADLKGIVDLAIEGKLQDAMRTGVPKPVTTKDLLRALKSHRPTTREWFGTARNHALYANEGGAYDDVLTYMKAAKLG